MPLVDVLAPDGARAACASTSSSRVRSARARAAHERCSSREIYALAGGEFNISSPPQLREVLFDRLKISTQRRPPRQDRPLDRRRRAHAARDATTRCREDPRLPRALEAQVDLRRRAAGARRPARRAPAHLVQPDGRRDRAALAPTEPNLQNIPIRTRGGPAHPRRVRARAGHRCSSRPTTRRSSSACSRTLRRPSGCVDAFRERRGRPRAHRGRGLSRGAVRRPADQRRAAKVINFGIIYGMGPARLAKELEISHEEAEPYIASYFERYAGVAEYMRRTIAEARAGRLRDDAVRPPAPDSRAREPARAACASSPSGSRSTRRSRGPPPT